MRASKVGSKPKTLAKGDVVDVSEGTVVSAAAVVLVYILHQNVELPVEIEAAATVLVYAIVRLAVRWLRDTRVDEMKEADDV